jgi:hypothetical protein
LWFVHTRAQCLLKRDREEARERAEDLVAVLVRPVQPVLQETQPTNTMRARTRSRGEKEKLWDGGASAHWEQEEWTATKTARGSPPTHQPAAQPMAGRRRCGRRLLPRAHLLALKSSSYMDSLSAFATTRVCTVLNLTQTSYMDI